MTLRACVFASVAVAVVGFGCVVENTAPSRQPGRVDPPVEARAEPGSVGAIAAASANPAADAGLVDATLADRGPPENPPAVADFHACQVDSDCVAVPKVGCCHNGEKVSVNVASVDAYSLSFRCPEPRPLCPMYMRIDTRSPECSAVTHACEMVKTEDIRCGGLLKSQHLCPTGFQCKPAKTADLAGTCVK